MHAHTHTQTHTHTHTHWQTHIYWQTHMHTFLCSSAFLPMRFKHRHSPIFPLRVLLCKGKDPYFEDLNWSLLYFWETFLAAVTVWVTKVGHSSKPSWWGNKDLNLSSTVWSIWCNASSLPLSGQLYVRDSIAFNVMNTFFCVFCTEIACCKYGNKHECILTTGTTTNLTLR